jgi:hypothetical protein
MVRESGMGYKLAKLQCLMYICHGGTAICEISNWNRNYILLCRNSSFLFWNWNDYRILKTDWSCFIFSYKAHEKFADTMYVLRYLKITYNQIRLMTAQ